MKLGPVAPPAEIAIETRDVGRGLEAPTPVPQTLRSEVGGIVAELTAVLRLAREVTI